MQDMRRELTEDEMRYIALLESVTGASGKDCVVDEEHNRVLYVIGAGQLRSAIGRDARNVCILAKLTGKRCEMVEWADEPAQFIKNALKPAVVSEVRISEGLDGKKMALVMVNPKDKGLAIGRNGRNVERLRFLVRRYFQVKNIKMV